MSSVPPTRIHFLLLLITGWLMLPGFVAALPVASGLVTPENRYQASLELVYANNFENAGNLFPLGFRARYATDANEVLRGARSIYLEDLGVFTVVEPEIQLIAGETYVVEFEYRLVEPETSPGSIFTGFFWDGITSEEISESGPIPGSAAHEGSYHHNMLLPPDKTQFEILVGVSGGPAVIDEFRVYRLVNRIYPDAPNLLHFAFPRLSNFHVYATQTSGLIHAASTEEIRDVLARHDLVNGIDIDHTLGGSLDFLPLKERHPDILLLPYHQTFMSVLTPTTIQPPVGGVAGVLRAYNAGLADDWFLKSPTGERLNGPRYPYNFQMNLTDACPVVDGLQFLDYTRLYLTGTVLPSGYWAGIHFDQSTWYPNVLLSDNSMDLVPMDADNDGIADAEADLYAAWFSAYRTYFDHLDSVIGQSAIFFGNEGEMPLNPEVVRRMNGFLFEFFSPYDVLTDGSYQTRYGSFWHRYLDVQIKAHALLRVPQIVATQMTGRGLGVPTGTVTENGFPDREPTLVLEDYLRMRFGLGTSLLVDGFFGYDYIDNSTIPTAWLDEFGVDTATGQPSLSLEHRHYLGQPLGAAVELSAPGVEIFSFDFEEGIPDFSTGVFFLEQVSLETDPELVIGGSQSIRVSFSADPLNPQESQAAFISLPSELPLSPDASYQLYVDYRVVDYNPLFFGAFFAMGVADFDDDTTLNRFAIGSLLYSDTVKGLEGTLRSSAKITSATSSAFAALTDSGTVILDNIRLVQSTGGVFRRDFEQGVVCVNPTAEAIELSLADLQGPLQRTGLRRIAGVQDPLLNDGSVVDGPITLSPAQAIILLADSLPAPAPEGPTGLSAAFSNEGVVLDWLPPAGGTVAGYVVRFGLAGGDATRYRAFGPGAKAVLKDLLPGRTYTLDVATFDYIGTISDYSAPIAVDIPGEAPAVIPQFTFATEPVPGQVCTLAGTDLASGVAVFMDSLRPTEAMGARVLINGLPAQLISVSPTSLEFMVPENLGGEILVARVERDGISSVSRYQSFPRTMGLPTAVGISSLIPGLAYEIDWQGAPNAVYRIEYSSDLMNWIPRSDSEKPAVKGYSRQVLEFDSPINPIFFRVRELSQ